MQRREQHLIQQVESYRKENIDLKLQCRNLKAEVNRQKRNAAEANKNAMQIQKLSQKQAQTINGLTDRTNEMQRENAALQGDITHLQQMVKKFQDKYMIISNKAFDNMTGNERTRVKKKLETHFHHALKVHIDSFHCFSIGTNFWRADVSCFLITHFNAIHVQQICCVGKPLCQTRWKIIFYLS